MKGPCVTLFYFKSLVSGVQHELTFVSSLFINKLALSIFKIHNWYQIMPLLVRSKWVLLCSTILYVHCIVLTSSYYPVSSVFLSHFTLPLIQESLTTGLDAHLPRRLAHSRLGGPLPHLSFYSLPGCWLIYFLAGCVAATLIVFILWVCCHHPQFTLGCTQQAVVPFITKDCVLCSCVVLLMMKLFTKLLININQHINFSFCC